ncbi:SAM domain-containing protein SAMSN-1 [Gastrophryne carolinensis]
MNLFCFSLEGSMDSLYEPVQNIQDNPKTIVPRASSPPCVPTKTESLERSLSMENDPATSPVISFSQQDVELPGLETTDANKRRKKSLIQKSVSENEAFDRRVWSGTRWHNSRRPDDDSYLRRHCHIEDLSEEDYMNGDRANLLTRIKEENPWQVPQYEQWGTLPNLDSNSYGCPNETEQDGSTPEPMGTLKRLQRMVRTKKANDDVRHTLLQSPTQDVESEEEEPLVTCMKLGKSQEKKACKDAARKKQEIEYSAELKCSSLDRSMITRRNVSRGVVTCPENHLQFLTNWKTYPGSPDPFNFPMSWPEEWEPCICYNRHCQLPPSFTDMDLPYAWRNSSFGAFDRFKKLSVSKAEDLNELGDSDSIFEGGPADPDKASNNAGGITKKMKAISLTMRKKMGKKYIKALSQSEDDNFLRRDSDPVAGLTVERNSLQNSESVESLYSLNSGQSSSSGVTSCSEGTSNRDSFRFDEDTPYTGPFCGRAKVHTDFTPSPYDTESLKIKKGDVIDIIFKTPMGIWTGVLNNKVGTFKFIYVDIITEEEEAPVTKKIVRQRSQRPKPKSLQELLERFNLQEFMSSLLLNGYQTLEDLRDIKESHLCELNITNAEQRMRLLVAIENLQEPDGELDFILWGWIVSMGFSHYVVDQGFPTIESEKESSPLTLNPKTSTTKCELSDCPRDSGCYITLDHSENGKEDAEPGKLCEAVEQITVTECP